VRRGRSSSDCCASWSRRRPLSECSWTQTCRGPKSLTTNTQAAARAVGLQLVVLGASTERDIDAALATFVQQRASALLITASPFFFTQADYLIALVNIERNPTASATAASASCTEAGRSSESPFRLARA
jgi:hypothetical protein